MLAQHPQAKQQAHSPAASVAQDLSPPSAVLPGASSAASQQPPDWTEVLAALRLDERQLHYLKLLQKRHQERMRVIISARQALSMEVGSSFTVRFSVRIRFQDSLGTRARSRGRLERGLGVVWVSPTRSTAGLMSCSRRPHAIL